MLHNPEDYPDPHIFTADRFIGTDGQIDPTVRDPMTISFGFGRRYVNVMHLLLFHRMLTSRGSSCPGRWLSNSSLFSVIASTLHTMNVLPVLGPEGKRFDPFNDDHVYSGIGL